MARAGLFGCFSAASPAVDPPTQDGTSTAPKDKRSKGNRRQKDSFCTRLCHALDILCNGEIVYQNDERSDRDSTEATDSVPTTTRLESSTVTSISSRKASAAAQSAEAEEGLANLGARTKSVSKSVTFHVSVTDKGAGMRGVAALLAARQDRRLSGVVSPGDGSDTPLQKYAYPAPTSKAAKSILKHTQFVEDGHTPVTTNEAILNRQETPCPVFPRIYPDTELSGEITPKERSLEGYIMSQDGYNCDMELSPQGSGQQWTPVGSARSPQGSAKLPQGSARSPVGSARSPQSSAELPQGSARLPVGSARSPQGSAELPVTSNRSPCKPPSARQQHGSATSKPRALKGALKVKMDLFVALPAEEVAPAHHLFDNTVESPKTKNLTILNRMQTPYNSGRFNDVDSHLFDDGLKSPKTRNPRVSARMQTPYAQRGTRRLTGDSEYSRFSRESSGPAGAENDDQLSWVSAETGLDVVETGLRSFSGPVLGAALLRLVEGGEPSMQASGDATSMSEANVMEREIEEAIALARSGARLVRETSRSATPSGQRSPIPHPHGMANVSPLPPSQATAPKPSHLPSHSLPSHLPSQAKPPLPWPPVGLGLGTKPLGPPHGLTATRVPQRRQSHWAEDTAIAALLLTNELKRAASRAASRCSDVLSELPESASASVRTSRASSRFTSISTATALAAVAMASAVSRSVSMASYTSVAGANQNSVSWAADQAVAAVNNPLADPYEVPPGRRPCLAELSVNGCLSKKGLLRSPSSQRPLSLSSQRSVYSSVHDDDDSACGDEPNEPTVQESHVPRCRPQIQSENSVTTVRSENGLASNLRYGSRRPSISPLFDQAWPAQTPLINADNLTHLMQRGMLGPDDSRTSSWVQSVAERAATAAAAAAAQAWADAMAEAEERGLTRTNAWADAMAEAEECGLTRTNVWADAMAEAEECGLTCTAAAWAQAMEGAEERGLTEYHGDCPGDTRTSKKQFNNALYRDGDNESFH